MPITDDSLVAQYIRAIENPDSAGFKDGKWYKEVYDANNRGFGVDVVNNNAAAKVVAGREGKWLTEDEERELRLNHIKENQDALEKHLPPYILRNPISENKKTMALGILYRGDSVTQNPKILDAYLNGTDEEMQKAVSDFYLEKQPNPKTNKGHYMPERSRLHNQFFSHRNKKSDEGSVPVSIRKPKPYTPPSYEPEQFVPGKKYANGGYLNNAWDSLSYKDKAEMMKVAIDNGITTLPEIRKAYNEFAKGGRMNTWTMQDEDGSMGYYPTMDNKGNTYTETWKGNNIFADGGYIPSDSIKKRIANWEGASMKTNRSFEAEAKDFNRVVPVSVRSKLSPQQLDAIYSYGYNVGMGRLKERVLPVLTAYTQGRATKEDVQRSMWATKDSQLRGLTNRRNAEREMFGGSYRTAYNDKNIGVHIDPVSFQIPQGFFDTLGTDIPQMQLSNGMDVDPSTLYKAPVIDKTLYQKPKLKTTEYTYNPKLEKFEGLRNFNTVMGLMGESTPLGAVGDSSPGLLSYINAIYGV